MLHNKFQVGISVYVQTWYNLIIYLQPSSANNYINENINTLHVGKWLLQRLMSQTNKMTWLKEIIKFPIDMFFEEINLLNLLVAFLDSKKPLIFISKEWGPEEQVTYQTLKTAYCPWFWQGKKSDDQPHSTCSPEQSDMANLCNLPTSA